MFRNLLLPFLFLPSLQVFAAADTVIIPINRQLFHERINEEQKLLDRADGKQDGLLRISGNAEINKTVTEIMFKKIDALEDSIELNKKIPGNNEKVRYLTYTASLLKAYRTGWKQRKYNPLFAPLLFNSFVKIMNANIDSSSMMPVINELPYETGKLLVDIFRHNVGVTESNKILFLKFCSLYPERILQGIAPYADEPFADSLIVICSQRNPTAIYSASQAPNSVTGKLIHRNNNPLVTTIINISKTPNSLLYFPFLDDLLKGNQTFESIQKYIGDGETTYDSVGYFKLLVQTEISYFKRMVSAQKDTPVAMFGANGLREMLHNKALQHFIKPINEMHEKPEGIRMRPIEPLSSTDLYYMLIMGETEIYTSSYKYSFNRLIQRLGKSPKTDLLLLNVYFDYFKKFIKLAANFNKLDEFLNLMPPGRSQMLMRAFVGNLDKAGDLEDAVDVADSYSSITDKKLLQTILDYVIENENAAIQNDNARSKIIYGLLKTIFLSAATDTKVDLTLELGIPSIYQMDNTQLADENGRIIQQLFFYGDDDGKAVFNGFINSFAAKDWEINLKPEWAEIKSRRGKKIWIYANRPLDNDSNLDDSAQVHLNAYLYQNELHPSIVVHRGHSYWLPRTLKRMSDNSKIVILGSCGGYKNLNDILDYSPDAHIISTKEIGRGDINKPVLNYINQILLDGKTLVWKTMWETLTRLFYSADRNTRDSWENYIPPYKNLGAIFIKAYLKKMETE